jgi:hypothetical protein
MKTLKEQGRFSNRRVQKAWRTKFDEQEAALKDLKLAKRIQAVKGADKQKFDQYSRGALKWPVVPK